MAWRRLLQSANGFSCARISSAAAGCGRDDDTLCIACIWPAEARRRESLGRRIAEADEDDWRSPPREMVEHPDHQRSPEWQMPPHLMRIALALEARKRERGVEKQYARRHPAIGKGARRFQVDRAVLDGRQCRWPSRKALGVMGLPGPGGHDELDDRTHAGREHLVELPPARDVAGLEAPAGGEGGAGIGVLAQNHAAHGRRRESVEGAQHVRAGRRTGKRPSATSRKDRLPRLELERGVHIFERQVDMADHIPPKRIDVSLPAFDSPP